MHIYVWTVGDLILNWNKMSLLANDLQKKIVYFVIVLDRDVEEAPHAEVKWSQNSPQTFH